MGTMTEVDIDSAFDSLVEGLSENGWIVVVHNDDVNTFDWVELCLQKHAGCTAKQAAKHAETIHTTGKSVVWKGDKAEAEVIAGKLLAELLNAQAIKDGE